MESSRVLETRDRKFKSYIPDFMQYFLNFVEEGIFNERYIEHQYVGGRMEIWVDDQPYAIDEIRFLTNKKSWFEFRDQWDFKEVDKKTLVKLSRKIKKDYFKPLENEA